MISREEAGRPMKKRMVLPAIAVLLVGLWMILVGQGAEDLAELCVTKIVLDPPSTINRGEVVEVYARVMNTGSRSADGFNISFFYRHQNSTGNWTLRETAQGVSLPPSHQDFYEVTFYLDTTDMDLGTYDLRIIADSANHISEMDELNNELRTTMTLQDSSLGLPDLQSVSLSYVHTNPGTTDDMEPWNVTTQILNLGEVQAGQFVVAFLVDGSEFARQIRFVLPAGGVTDIIAELDPQNLSLESGTHRFSFVIDPDNEVVEQNEGNNTVSGFLTLQSVELVPLSLIFDKSLLRLDEEIRVSAEVRNDGEGVAKNVEVAFYAGHIRFASGTIDILGRGMTATVEGILDPEKQGLVDAPAVYVIRVVVDPNDLLHEFDEANNEMSRTLTILPPEVKKAELHPESLILSPASPAEQRQADVVTVTSVIRNTGRAASGPFDVGFYYRVKGGLRWDPFPCSDPSSCSEIELAAGSDAPLVGVLRVSDLGLSPGIYEIRVAIDVQGAIDELDETNNELVTTLTLLASRLPDLAFCPEGGLTLEPTASAQRGQTIRLTACIVNFGEQDAGLFTVRLSYCPLTSSVAGTSTVVQCSDTYRESHFSPGPEIEIAGLAIGESITRTVMLETRDLAPGQYQIRVEIDPDHAVRERDEANNSLVGTRLAVLGPDLAVVGLTTSPEGVVDQAVSDELEIVATLLNAGVVPMGEFSVRFRLFRVSEQGLVAVRVHVCGETSPTDCESPEHFCDETLSGIGVLVPEQVRWTLDLAETDLDPGQYIVRVEADCEGDIDGDGVCDGKIPEHNELNNMLELPLVILPRPADLVVKEPIEFPKDHPVDYGEVVPIKATIANIGGSTADGACTTTPSCGIGIEFLVYEPGTRAEDGEQLLRITPAEPIHSLEPGEEIQVTALLETDRLDPFVTDYRVLIRVDPSHSIEELDESNNDIELPLVIRLLPADLLITDTVMYAEGELVQYGDAVPIRVTIANVGFSTAQAACTSVPSCGVDVEFLVYVGTSAGGDELLRILPDETIDALEPGEEVQVTGVLETDRLDPLVTDYRVRIIVDPSNRIEEINESDNEVVLPLALQPLPADLAIAGPIAFPEGTPVKHGDVVPITAMVANIGGSTAEGACGTSPSCGIGVEFLIYEYGIQGDEGERIVRVIPYETILVLDPGDVVQVTAFLKTEILDPFMTGYRVCVRVDPSDSIEELDESNNELCTSPQLELYPPPPDLKLASASSEEPLVRFDPPPPVEYGDQPIRAFFSIVNDSRSPSTGFNVAFRLRAANVEDAQWIELDKLAVDGLAAGEQRPFSYVIVLPPAEDAEEQRPLPPGVYEFCITVDVDGFVPEIDEQNNTYCTPIGLIVLDGTVVGPAMEEGADLSVRSMCAQVASGWLGLSSVKATIANLGDAAAGPFTVTAYYIPAVGADPVAIVDSGHGTRYDGLAVGEDASFRQDFDTAGLENGTYPVFIVVDSANEVTETDEDNNIMYDTLWIH